MRQSLRGAIWMLMGSAIVSAGNAATFMVTSQSATGAGTLDAAIDLANTTAGADTINFAIAGTGIKVLSVPAAGLRPITETLLIDGYTQTGANVNTTPTGGTNAILRIELNAATTDNGAIILTLAAPTTVRGLAINGISGGRQAIRISAAGSGSSVRGCLIGVGAAGTGTTSGGIGVSAGGPVQIGSSIVADRNLFANLGNAISLTSGSSGSFVQNNLFGSLPNGTGSQPVNSGVSISSSSNATNVEIGGEDAGEGNVFRNSNNSAIFIGNGPATGISILGNSISGSLSVPIDLGGDGVDLNDHGDADTGPNRRQNAPELQFAVQNGSTLFIQGKLDSDFSIDGKRVELFASTGAHPSGSGEGLQFLAAGTLFAPATGTARNLKFSISVAAGLPPAPVFITATATGADGSTSEFSQAIPMVIGGTRRTVTNTTDGGSGSLRQALMDANGAAGVDTIAFSIAGDGPHVISPASALPAITGDLIIDGYAEPLSEPNLLPSGSNAVLKIVLDGNGAGAANGLQVTGGNTRIRGLNIRNFDNVGISMIGGSAHLVEGCFIGTNDAGTTDQGNRSSGVSVASGVVDVQIGGSGPHQRNLISGNNGSGLSMSANGWVVENNLLGTAANGVDGLGNNFGALVASGSGARVENNRIRNNGMRGVGLPASAVQVDLRGNQIGSNGGQGIDLNNDGLTPNDPNDADTGPNGLQNFPVLDAVIALASGDLRVQGTLDRPAAGTQTFRFDIFSSGNCDANGNGEGENFLGSASVQFVAAAPETFSFDLPDVTVPAGAVITSTATTAGGATSEFSTCLNATVQPDAVFASGFE